MADFANTVGQEEEANTQIRKHEGEVVTDNDYLSVRW